MDVSYRYVVAARAEPTLLMNAMHAHSVGIAFEAVLNIVLLAGGRFPLSVNISRLSGDQTIVISVEDPTDGARAGATITVAVPSEFESNRLLRSVSLCCVCYVQLSPLSLPQTLRSTWSVLLRSWQEVTK